MSTCAHGFTANEPCRHCRPTPRRRRAHNSTLPVPAGPIRPNRKRRASEFDRAYGSEARVKWIQMQESVVSGRWPCVNAHVEPRGELPSGVGRKAGFEWIVPLTQAEHTELHQIGQQTFEAKHEIDLTAAAIETDRRWRRHTAEVSR